MIYDILYQSGENFIIKYKNRIFKVETYSGNLYEVWDAGVLLRYPNWDYPTDGDKFKSKIDAALKRGHIVTRLPEGKPMEFDVKL